MKLLILTERDCDLVSVLRSCPVDVTVMDFDAALHEELSRFDAFCVLASGILVPDARLHEKLEREAEKGKRFFTEALSTFGNIYSEQPVPTVRKRLICVAPDGHGIPGIAFGDLLDDESGFTCVPYARPADTVDLLVFREMVIAHTHTNMKREEILPGSLPGMWKCAGNLLMTSFAMRDYHRARFAPRGVWEKLVRFIAVFLTGSEPELLPRPVVTYGAKEDLSDPDTWESCRKRSVRMGINWMKRFLVDGGRGGIEEGLKHNIRPDGIQEPDTIVRTDCSGESAGAFRLYGALYGDTECLNAAEALNGLVYGPLQIRGGLFDGMLRWSSVAWGVCYQDDAARAILPGLYMSLFLGDDRWVRPILRCLDFLVKTTCRDGLRPMRTDCVALDENGIRALTEAEHGIPTAHYNAWYHAALLLAYRKSGKREYLDTAVRGLETLISLYPDMLRREQSETEEACRLLFPLSVLYETTREDRYRAMISRVTDDLEKHRHSSGGFLEWDTGYTAACSRFSTGECSILTENGDPVADLLYSSNWLPIGFAYAYRATGDERYKKLWKETVTFFLRAQMFSDDPKLNGGWCRSFDMDLGEAYGCPHDLGWAANAAMTGWMASEILMGMMLPDVPGFWSETDPGVRC